MVLRNSSCVLKLMVLLTSPWLHLAGKMVLVSQAQQEPLTVLVRVPLSISGQAAVARMGYSDWQLGCCHGWKTGSDCLNRTIWSWNILQGTGGVGRKGV